MSELRAFNRILTPPLRQEKAATQPSAAKGPLSLRPTAAIADLTDTINTKLLFFVPKRAETEANLPTVPVQGFIGMQANILPQDQPQFTRNPKRFANSPLSPPVTKHPFTSTLLERPIKPKAELSFSNYQPVVQTTRSNLHRPQPQVAPIPPQKKSLPTIEHKLVVKRQIIKAVLRQLPLFPNVPSQLSIPQEQLSNSTQPVARSQVSSAPQPDTARKLQSKPMPKKVGSAKPTQRVFTPLKPKIRPLSANIANEVRVQPAPIKVDSKFHNTPAPKKQTQPLTNVTPKHPSSRQPIPVSKVEATKTLKPQTTSPQLRPQISTRSLPSPNTPSPTPPQRSSSVKIEIGRVEIVAKAASKTPSPKRQPVRPHSHSIKLGLTFFEGGN